MGGIFPALVTHPDGSIDTFSFNATTGLLTSQHPAAQERVSYTYGNKNQVLTVSGTGIVGVTNTLDALGRVMKTQYGTLTADTTRFTYDPVTMNVASTTGPDGTTERYQYEMVFGNVLRDSVSGGRMMQSFYDAYGRDTSSTSPMYNRTRTVYDVLNRVTATYDSVGAAPVTIDYDAILPIAVHDQLGHTDATTYDALGRPIKHLGYASSSDSTTIRYDAAGRPTSTTNRRGQVMHVTYDALGRVLTKSGDNTTTDTFTYSADGLTQTATNATSSIRMVSVPSARLDTVQTTITASGVTQHTYTVVHHASSVVGGTDSTTITSDGAPAQFVTRRYTGNSTDGTLESINLGAGIGTSSFTYNPSLERTATFWPTAGLRTSNYLTTGTLAQESYGFGSNMDDSLGQVPHYASMSYRVDSAGRIRATDDRVVGYKPPNHQITGGDTTLVYDHKRLYVYDAMGRYTGTHDATLYSWTCDNDPSGYNADYGSFAGCAIDSDTASKAIIGDYKYDAVGNLNGTGYSLVSGHGDQLATAVVPGTVFTYTYDADGNVLTRTNSAGSVWSYTWSADNLLMKGGLVTTGDTVSFDYDALGNPVVKRDRDGKIERVTLYDGASILADLDSLGNRKAEYVYDAGTDRPYAVLTGATAVTGAQYFIQDAMGNVRATVLDSLNVAQDVTYSGWGVPQVEGDNANRLTWKGLSYDSDLGLTYVRARWYDPSIGRFVSEDPMGLQAGINPYLFAEDDPINGFDPSGLDDCITVVIKRGTVVCAGGECTVTAPQIKKECPEDDGGNMGPPLGVGAHRNPIPSDGTSGTNGTPTNKNSTTKNKTPSNVNMCSEAGAAPDPSGYVKAAKDASIVGNIDNLLQFRRGGLLDAQVRYQGSPAYANYVFGVYMSARGYALSQTLSAANTYAHYRADYKNTPMAFPNYPYIPQSNVTNITTGFNAQKKGDLCHT